MCIRHWSSVEQNLLKWQPISTEESNNRLIFRGMEGFWAAIAPFNFTAISGHLAGAPAFMVSYMDPSVLSVVQSVCVIQTVLILLYSSKWELLQLRLNAMLKEVQTNFYFTNLGVD